MTIKAGNVGIGTNAPNALLHLYKNSASVVPLTFQNTLNAFTIQYSRIDANSDRLDFIDGGFVTDMSIKNGGNVGIGTTVPNEKLEVSASAQIDNYLSLAGGPTAFNTVLTNPLIYESQTGGAAYPFQENGNLVLQGRPSVGRDIDFVTNNPAKVQMVVDRTGNVGIGTTAPGAKFHINGSSLTWAVQSTGQQVIGYAANAAVAAGTGLAINANVGIGTTAPGDKLDIAGGNVRVSGASGNGLIIFQGDTHRYGQILVDTSAGQGSGTGQTLIIDSENTYGASFNQRIDFKTANSDRMVIEYNGNVGIGTMSPRAKLDVDDPNGAYIGDNTSRIWLGSNGVGSNYIESGNPAWNASPVLNITGYDGNPGTTAFNGNVGIGTTNPIARLDFGATGSGVPLFYLNSSVDLRGFGLDMSGNGYEFSNFFPSNASSRYAIGTYNGTTFNTKMVVLNNGNVGIGSMAPGSKLDILGGDINLSINRALRHNGVWTIGSDGTTISVGSTATARNVGIYTNGATPTVYANTSGNVGIGTTNPGYKFAVVAPGCGDGIVAVSGSTSGRADLSVACGNQAGIVDIYDQTGTLRSMLQSNGYSFLGGGNLSISADGYHYANELLDVFGGNGHVQAGYSWYSGSDVRLKKNITELDNSLQKVLSLRGVRYDLKTDNNSIPGQGKNIGFIAQELEQQYPELVLTDKDGMKSVAYDKMTAILVEAIKEQQKQIDAQQKEIDALKAK
jgi:hypothetical protein